MILYMIQIATNCQISASYTVSLTAGLVIEHTLQKDEDEEGLAWDQLEEKAKGRIMKKVMRMTNGDARS